MIEKDAICSGCALSQLGEGFMRPSLAHSPLAALVGEALGEQEAQHGAPFVGPAGFLLTRLISWAGFSRKDFDIWNIVWCRPPNNHLEGAPYQQSASAHCLPHWADLPRRVNVLVPMGNVPLFNLLGKREILTNRGYVFQRYDGKLVLPTVHPSFIQRGNTNYGRAFINDLQHAVHLAKNGFPATYRDYRLDPLPVDAERWVRDYEQRLASDPTLLLAYDIETPYKNEDEGELDGEDTRSILRIGFSYEAHTGLSIPFETAYFPLIRRLLESAGAKVVWNASFDNSHLQQAGFSIKGPIHDGMVAWHILHSDLPKGLGFVSTFTCWDQPEWKSTSHLAPARYNCTDADVEQRSCRMILQQLKDANLWRVYDEDVLQLEPILLHMHDVGMPIDAKVRAEKAKLLTETQTKLKGEMNAIVPLGAKKLKIYKTKPKKLDFAYEWTDVEQLANVPTCISCGLEHPKKPHFKLFKKKANPCGGKSAELVAKMVKRLARVEPFVPSRDQIFRYQNFLGRELPTTWDPKEKKRKLTSNEKALTQLVKDYPQDKLYPLILVYRDAEKVAGTYVGRWDEERGIVSGGFPVGLDGRVHTTFSHNPSSLRLSSFNPNLQNIPRGGDFGKWVKECFVAGAGKLFYSLDFSAIEAVLVGYFCGDPQMIKLAKLGIHAFLASHLVGRPADLNWSEADLRAYFKELKANEKYTYDVAKRVVHSTNYLVTPKKLHMEFPLEFKSIKEANRLQRIYLDLFPSLGRWHKTLCERVDGAKVRVNADDDPKTPWSLGVCHVVNPFGYKHDFYHVLNWEKIGDEWFSSFGEDAKRLVSFLPQSTASAILKAAVKRIWAYGGDVAESLRLLIHDDLMGEAAEARIDYCLAICKAEMEAPIKQLPLDPTWKMGNYLTIGTEAKVGKSWGTMH